MKKCCCCRWLPIIIKPIWEHIHFFQVEILLRELCRLHNVPLPSEVDRLLLPPHAEIVKDLRAQHQIDQHQAAVDDSDADEIEDATLGRAKLFEHFTECPIHRLTKTGLFFFFFCFQNQNQKAKPMKISHLKWTMDGMQIR